MNVLMQKLLERRGIYMAPAGADGAEGGSGAGAQGDTGGQANGDTNVDGDNGDGQSGDRGNTDDDSGDGDGDGAADDKTDGDKAGSEGDKDKAKDGKPTDREAQLLKDAMKWKEKARDLEKSVKAIQEQLGDVDPATARKLADEAKERERADLEKKGEYDRIVQQMRDENQKLLKTKDETVSELQTELQKARADIADLTLGAKFRESEFITKQSTLPPTIAQKEFGDYFEYEDGVAVPYDKPKGAKDRTKVVDADGNPKKFDQAIAELYAQHPDAKSLMRSTVKPGAGSRSQSDVKNDGKAQPEVRGIGKIQLGLEGQAKTKQ